MNRIPKKFTTPQSSRARRDRAVGLPSVAALLAVASLSLVAAAPAVAPAAAAATTTARYAYGGSAYGTYAAVGTVVKSGPSAPITFGCSAAAGQHRTNTTAGLNLAPLARTGTISTIGDTYATPVRSRTSATTNQVNLLNGLVHASTVRAVSSTSQAGTGFAVSSSGTTFTALIVGGIPVRADAAPNTRINLAGFGYVVVNEQTKTTNGLRVNGLHLFVTTTNALGVAVNSQTVISDAVTSLSGPVAGVLGGSAYGTHARLGSVAVSGPTFRETMPCLGTGGIRRVNTGAGITLGTAVTTGTITDTAQGSISVTSATGELTSTVQAANLINGLVKASVIKADAHATATATGNAFSDKGSTFGSLSVAGHPTIGAQVAPNTTVTLKGVGTLYLHRVIRGTNTITVTMIELVLTNPVNGLAAGTDITISTAYATVR